MAGVKVTKMPLQLIFRKYHDTYVTTVLLPLLGSGKLILMQCRVNLCFNTQCQNSDFCFQLIRTCNDVLTVTTRKNAGDLSRHLNYQVIIFCPRDQGTSCINSSSQALALFKIFSIKNWNLNLVNELGPKQNNRDGNAIQLKDKSHDFFLCNTDCPFCQMFSSTLNTTDAFVRNATQLGVTSCITLEESLQRTMGFPQDGVGLGLSEF